MLGDLCYPFYNIAAFAWNKTFMICAVRVLKRIESWLVFHQVYITSGMTIFVPTRYEAKFIWNMWSSYVKHT